MPEKILNIVKKDGFTDRLCLGLIFIGVIIYALFIPPGTLKHIGLVKNVYVPASLLVIAIILLFDKKKRYAFHWVDLIFFSFVCWHFLSWFWASNPSVIWGKSFKWLFLFCCYIIIKSLDIRQLSIKKWLTIFLTVNFYNYLILVWFFFKISTSGESFGFNFSDLNQAIKIIGQSPNRIATNLVMLFPVYILVFQQIKKYKYIVIFGIILHSSFLLIFNCRGATLAFLLQLAVIFAYYKKGFNFKKVGLIITITAITTTLFFLLVKDSSYYIQQYNPFYRIQATGEDDRLKMWQSSIQLLQENPLLGKGVDNWFLAYPKYGLSQFSFSYDSDRYFQHPHNQYFHILSELGITGLLFYLIIIFYFLFLYLKNIRQIEDKSNSIILLCLLITYLIIACFFGIVYGERHAAPLPILVLFLSFGIAHSLAKGDKIHDQVNWLVKISCIISLATFLAFSKKTHSLNRNANMMFNLMNKKKNEKALALFESTYHPSYYTMHRRTNRITTLKTHKARILKQMNKTEEAISVMLEAIAEQPYYHMQWFALGQLYEKQKDWGNAKICYNNVYEINDKFLKAQIKLIEINLSQNNLEEARKWYNKINTILTPIMERYEQDRIKGKKRKEGPFNKFKSYERQLKQLEAQILKMK